MVERTLRGRLVGGVDLRMGAHRHRRAFDGVECYVTFVGHPRNGSTLVGALLDAHPDAVVCHELGALALLDVYRKRDHFYFRHVRRSRWFFDDRDGSWAGYDYRVPGQWQGGRYRNLLVIGDKRARLAAVQLTDRPALVDRLAELTGARLAWIQVVRDPFDNLATMVRRKGRTVAEEADRYFSRCAGIDALRRRFPGSMIDVHHDDLTADPVAELRRVCDHVGLDHDAEWLAASASIVHASSSRTKDGVAWDEMLTRSIRSRMEHFDWLERYVDAAPV